MLKWLAIAPILVAGFFSWIFYKANLIIHTDTQVFDVFPMGTERQIALLHAGDKLAIVACMDEKTMYAYKVHLKDGRTGYILPGGPEIERKAFLFPPYSQPIV
jgi:hypothetical protein